jgi:DNA polymerase V
MPPSTIFALMDCNNFYASCERAFNPKLRGKPIVVLSNNDGCVIAQSNEAKALGITMGAPAFKFQPLFRKHGVHVFSTNFALYGDMSRRLMDTAARFTCSTCSFSSQSMGQAINNPCASFMTSTGQYVSGRG